MAARINAEEVERLRSWLSVIAETLLPDATFDEDSRGERKYNGQAGLHINIPKGAWYDFGLERGGVSPITLVQRLKNDCTYDSAIEWLILFGGTHAGAGPCGGQDEAAEDGEGSDTTEAAFAWLHRELTSRRTRARGTVTRQYLSHRGIELLPEDNGVVDVIGHTDDARLGESAFIAMLSEGGRDTSAMVTYLTPFATKSQAKPNRRRLDLVKTKAPPVLRLPPPDPTGALDPIADYLVGEGMEDALSLYQLRRNLTVIGVPGVGAIKDLGFRKGDRVIIVADGDEPGSRGAKDLAAAVDALLLAGVKVRVTRTALGEDANQVLVHWGIDILRELCACPPEAQLSLNGRITRLAELDDPVAAAQERLLIAKIFNVGVKVVDDSLKALRRARAAATKPKKIEDEDDGVPMPPPDLEWEEEVNLAAALQTAVETAKRFLIAPAWIYDIMVLWSAVTHLVQDERIALPVMPQLAFQSDQESSGKSVGLEIVSTLSFRGALRASYTAATLFRKNHDDRVTFALTELHNVLSDKNGDMQAIINACHRRSEAFIDRTETDAKTGKRYVVTYRCWAALAWGSISSMPPEVQSRALVLLLRPSTPAESDTLEHWITPKLCPELINVRRQFSKWAAPVNALPLPKMGDGLFNRVGDNWRPLFAVAQLAGGDWPQRISDAAKAARQVEVIPSVRTRLLSSIRTVLTAAPDQKLPTPELIDALCRDEEQGWHTINDKRRIDAYWLRKELKNLLNPKGSQQWHIGEGRARQHKRGYLLSQFTDAFLYFLPPTLSQEVPESSGTSGTSGTDTLKSLNRADNSVPDYLAPSGTSGTGIRVSLNGGDPGVPEENSTGQNTYEQPASSPEETTPKPDTNPPGPAENSTGPSENLAAASPAPEKGPRRRKNTITEEVLKLATAHPDWSDTRIGGEVGRPASEVSRIRNQGTSA